MEPIKDPFFPPKHFWLWDIDSRSYWKLDSAAGEQTAQHYTSCDICRCSRFICLLYVYSRSRVKHDAQWHTAPAHSIRQQVTNAWIKIIYFVKLRLFVANYTVALLYIPGTSHIVYLQWDLNLKKRKRKTVNGDEGNIGLAVPFELCHESSTLLSWNYFAACH